MNLKERLLADLKSAMQEKDTIRKNTIQGIRAEILNWEKDVKNLGKEVTDEVVETLIQKEVKKRKDALDQFDKAGRFDLCEQTRTELYTLEEYLPKQLARDEIEAIVKEIIDDCECINMGTIMKLSKEKIGNQASGKDISDVVKELLK